MADYEELIGAKFSFGDSLDQELARYDQFIKALNEKGQQVKIGVAGSGGALDGIVKQLQEVKNLASGLDSQFKSIFGTGADAAEQSSRSIKQSVADAESAFVSAQKSQTEAAQVGSTKRIEIAQNEANAIRRTQEELKAKSQITPEVSRYGSQFLQQEIQKIKDEQQARLKAQDQFSGAGQFGGAVVEKEISRLETAQKKFEESRQAALKGAASGDQFEGAQQYGAGLVEKEISRLETAQQKFNTARQAALKGAPSGAEFEGAGTFGSSVVEKELARLQSQRASQLSAEQKQFEADRKEAEKYNAELDKSRSNAYKSSDIADQKHVDYGSKYLGNEITKLEEAKANSGVGGFFTGLGKGITPRHGTSAGSIGEFIGEAARFLAVYAALAKAAEAAAAAIELPFKVIAGGIQYLSEFQERASQLKTTLLDHGFFSKDPAQNLALAGEAADALQGKVDDLATKLHVKSQTIQAAFETFAGFGGNSLTASLSDSVQLAGLATGALQSQNPVIQQRTVATQLSKLTSGTLKDTDKLPAALGISADKLNEMAKGAATTHDLLQQIEAQAPGLANRIGNANDRFLSLVDSVKLFGERLEGVVAKPLFDILTEKLQALLKYLDDNKDRITQFATSLGTALALLVSEIGTAAQALDGGFGTVLKNIIYNVTTLVEGLGHVGNSIGRIVSFVKNGGATGNYAQQQKDNDRYDSLDKQLSENSDRAKAALFGPTDPNGINRFLKLLPSGDGYTGTTKPAPGKQVGNTPSDQIGAIRNSYSEQVAEVKKQSAAIRSAIEEDAKNFRISLIDAADLKEAAYQEETEKITKAGEKAKATLLKVVDGKDKKRTDNAKNSVIKSINENNLGLDLDSKNSLVKGQDAIDKQNDAIDAIDLAGKQQRDTDLLNADFAYKQELAKKGLISDAQALDNEQTYWDKLYKIRKDGIDKAIDAETHDAKGKEIPGDKTKLEKLRDSQTTFDTQQKDQNDKLDRQRRDVEYNERQRQFGLQEERGQAGVVGASNQADIDRHAGLTDSARYDNVALLQAQRQLLQTQQDRAVDTVQKTQSDFLRANPGASAAALAANPAIQAAQNKVSVINAELIKTDSLITDEYRQGQSNQQALDNLLGPANAITKSHTKGSEKGALGDIGQTASSLGNLAKNISGSIGAIEQGYQQGGAGGAVGAGLSQVGQFVPGPIGQAIAGAGAVVSLISDMFTKAAQEIGKEVAKAVDKVMEKYSTGQSTLNQTLASVQQQYATLVAKETGKKGGQQVLDTEGVQLQQQIDQLKQQQRQTIENFADQTIVGGGTNSVAQQWLQTWISVNKQVQEYKNAVGDTAAEQLANQYLNEQLDQQRKQLQDQYIQGQASAVNDALQLNQLLQQRNNYEDQYRQQVFSLQSADSLARRGNPAETTARQISLAKAQYNQETQQLNFQINTYQQKVDYEKTIFGLATTTADLQKQALTDQGYQLKEQIDQYQTIVALLAAITGLTAVNGQISGLSGLGITLPTGGYGINDGSLNPIPGYGAPGTTDNSITTINLTIPANVLPNTGTPQDFATAIGNELAYKLKTRGYATV
jgi:hypothetical protein